MKQNLVKFNNFVKEKQMKVEEGVQRSKKEHDIFTRKYEESKSLEQEQDVLMKAKDGLKKSIKEKIVYKNFLESVVDDKCGSFPRVTELMKRFESLVASKENSRHIWRDKFSQQDPHFH